ncbi:hypothetical protein BD410DRAFT_797183 [Rickenella mellea]|uniref:Ricin B lectin domain-containing protein n=1 Tax=Rickenella mellea TaxID=50990 RepID=A0A4Y7PGP8_9AGAM|nr:hypothetical protein BD410DRAFT_797183 [Rickenella mellea]
MSPPTGTYQIKNAEFKVHVCISNTNDGTSVSATTSAATTSLKWTVTKLDNGNYTFQNIQNVSYASCGDLAPKGHQVVGRGVGKPWVLTESVIKNQYTIAPVDSTSVYWGLLTGGEGSAVVLGEAAADLKNQWIFQPAV